MNRQHLFHAFDFDDQAIFDNEVNPIGGLELDSLIDNGQANLVLEMQTRLGEFVVHACVTCAFENAGTERRVHSHCRAYDDSAGFVGTHET